MISAKTVSIRLALVIVLMGFALLGAVQVAQTQDNPFSVTNLTPTSSFHGSKEDDPPAGDPPPAPANLPHEPAVSVSTVCDPASLSPGATTLCTINVQNVTTQTLTVVVFDAIPHKLDLVPGSVTGAEVFRNRILTHWAVLTGGEPGQFLVAPGSSPSGYVSLAALGVPPLEGIGDDSVLNFTTPPYVYQDQTYTDLALFSDGYVLAGVGSEADIVHPPQQLPDPALPNNVIAPFWTDLNPDAAGHLYAAVLSTDEATWIVLEWENVPAFDQPDAYTFQLWVAANNDAQDISMVYVQVDGAGAASGLSVGAENATGLVGDTYEAVPAPGEELEVTHSAPTPGQSHAITFQATAHWPGAWNNCALVKVVPLHHVYFDCFAGINTH